MVSRPLDDRYGVISQMQRVHFGLWPE